MNITLTNPGSGYEALDVLVARVAKSLEADLLRQRIALSAGPGIYDAVIPPIDAKSMARSVLAEIFKVPLHAEAGPFNCPPLKTLWVNRLGDKIEPFSWQGGYVWVRSGCKHQVQLWAYDEFWDWAIKTQAEVSRETEGS